MAGAPFLASFARSGDFDREEPSRERLPLDFALDVFVLFAIQDRDPRCNDGIAIGHGWARRSGERRRNSAQNPEWTASVTISHRIAWQRAPDLSREAIRIEYRRMFEITSAARIVCIASVPCSR